MRLGVVPFCNVKPFVAGYEYGGLGGPARVYASPRELTGLFTSRKVDAAFIPAFDYLQIKNTALFVPGFGVACSGPVASVRLFFRIPFEEITQVQVDERSATSAAMLEILFRHHWQKDVEFVPADVLALERPEAALVIGDRALLPMPGYESVDHGEAWYALSGHAMVFGVWVARHEDALRETLWTLARGLDWGARNIETIVGREAQRTGIPEGVLYDYLANRILYQIGPREMAGLVQFEEYTQHVTDQS